MNNNGTGDEPEKAIYLCVKADTVIHSQIEKMKQNDDLQDLRIFAEDLEEIANFIPEFHEIIKHIERTGVIDDIWGSEEPPNEECGSEHSPEQHIENAEHLEQHYDCVPKECGIPNLKETHEPQNEPMDWEQKEEQHSSSNVPDAHRNIVERKNEMPGPKEVEKAVGNSADYPPQMGIHRESRSVFSSPKADVHTAIDIRASKIAPAVNHKERRPIYSEVDNGTDYNKRYRYQDDNVRRNEWNGRYTKSSLHNSSSWRNDNDHQHRKPYNVPRYQGRDWKPATRRFSQPTKVESAHPTCHSSKLSTNETHAISYIPIGSGPGQHKSLWIPPNKPLSQAQTFQPANQWRTETRHYQESRPIPLQHCSNETWNRMKATPLLSQEQLYKRFTQQKNGPQNKNINPWDIPPRGHYYQPQPPKPVDLMSISPWTIHPATRYKWSDE